MGATYSQCLGFQVQVSTFAFSHNRTFCQSYRERDRVHSLPVVLQERSRQPISERPLQPLEHKLARKDAALLSTRSIDRQSNERTQSEHMYQAFKGYEQGGDDYEPEPSRCKALNEQRVQEIRKAGIDADQPNPQLDRLTKLCASIFCCGGATITLYCGEVLVVKSRVGIDERVPKHLSMKLAIGAWSTYATRPRLIAVADATLDARFSSHPMLQTTPPAFRFYASAPLLLNGQLQVGSLNIFDMAAKQLDASQCNVLRNMAQLAVDELAAEGKRNLGVVEELQPEEEPESSGRPDAPRLVLEFKNGNFNILVATPAWCEFTGIQQDEAIWKDLTDLFCFAYPSQASILRPSVHMVDSSLLP
ncbi:hypothetical protein WJX74_009837 [Apatococcus lobatus]|uniref:GAF domain-containing protein n=1 Tax=Apatococcus lobatus TaxID=904363 RepID=A0AAW1QU01_9CHLO